MHSEDEKMDRRSSTDSNGNIEKSELQDIPLQNIRTYRLFAVLGTAVGAITIIVGWLAFVNDMLEGGEFLILILVAFGLFIIVLYMLRQLAVSKLEMRLLEREGVDRYP